MCAHYGFSDKHCRFLEPENAGKEGKCGECGQTISKDTEYVPILAIRRKHKICLDCRNIWQEFEEIVENGFMTCKCPGTLFEQVRQAMVENDLRDCGLVYKLGERGHIELNVICGGAGLIDKVEGKRDDDRQLTLAFAEV